jgi:hypothetical protein
MTIIINIKQTTKHASDAASVDIAEVVLVAAHMLAATSAVLGTAEKHDTGVEHG